MLISITSPIYQISWWSCIHSAFNIIMILFPVCLCCIYTSILCAMTYQSVADSNSLNYLLGYNSTSHWIMLHTYNHMWCTSMASCQKGPTRHAYAWQIGPFWQDTLDMCVSELGHHWFSNDMSSCQFQSLPNHHLNQWSFIINLTIVNW